MLFYVLQNSYCKKCCIFFEDLLPYTFSRYYIKWR